MNLNVIKNRVKEIKAIAATDPESAHSKEDDLYADIIATLASGGKVTREMAQEALKTQKMDFPRWCA